MNFTDSQLQFIEALAITDTGAQLIELLKDIEHWYADIRNLQGTKPEVRIDALAILREALLDKLLVMSGKMEPADNDEYH